MIAGNFTRHWKPWWRPARRDYEVPEWQRPRAVFVRGTDEQRWQNYYRIALAELDEEMPD